MDSQEQQLIDRIKQAQNVLVTVSSNPSVDQLAAAIGLTVALNKLDKHGTAVFSGKIPDTIEFLKPETTLEKNTDSLRDFIIALDKSKADKLRYKVEDQVVRIFITPYRTSLSEKDLQFSQGDFNVDVVIALGVADPKDLDTAITAHGRILHDATIASVSVTGKSNLGTIGWVDEQASSLSEMMLEFIDSLDKTLVDGQIATALLTGIVATTDRFRNEHTTPKAMNASAELMAAGANQQLIASELESSPMPAAPSEGHIHEDDVPQDGVVPDAQKTDDGALDIDHEAAVEQVRPTAEEYRAPAPEPDLVADRPNEQPEPQIHVDDNGQLGPAQRMPVPMNPFAPPPPPPAISQVHVVEPDEDPDHGSHRDRIDTPPTMGGQLTAADDDDDDEPPTESLTLPPMPAPILNHNESVLPPAAATPTPAGDGGFMPQTPLPAMPLPAPSLPPLAPTPGISSAPWQATPATQPSTPLSTALPVNTGSDNTLADIETAVGSPHQAQPVVPAQTFGTPSGSVDSARDAVQAALNSASPADEPPRQPIAALNALPLGSELHPMPAPPAVAASPGMGQPGLGTPPPAPTMDMPMPSNPFGPSQPTAPGPGATPSAASDVPSVPPPFVPPMPQ